MTVRLDVVQLEKGRLRAPSAPAHERAALLIPVRTVRSTWAGMWREPGADGRCALRLGGGCRLLLLHLAQEEGEGSVEDRARIAVRDLAAEKGLDAAQRSWVSLDTVNLRP